MYVNETTKGNIKADILLDSINSSGVRLTTAIIQIPRIVLAEFNTHRKLSRNSASSRAIPFKKMLELVNANPFIPLAVQKDHKGMQGSEYFNKEEYNIFKEIWLSNLDDAMAGAMAISSGGATKQLANRLLEPFMYHKILVTSTSFDNFTALRNHDAAEIHIAEGARKLTTALNNSTPSYLGHREMHLPFILKEDKNDYLNSEHFQEVMGELKAMQQVHNMEYLNPGQIYLALISAGRSARVSYNNFDGTTDHKKDYELACSLVQSGHWSPLEHQAISEPVQHNATSNFDAGWEQFRVLFNNQNRIDNRIDKY